MTGGTIHTVYTVTVKHPEASELQRYVIAAPTPQHAVTAVERSTGGRAYVWQVSAPVSGDQWKRAEDLRQVGRETRESSIENRMES